MAAAHTKAGTKTILYMTRANPNRGLISIHSELMKRLIPIMILMAAAACSKDNGTPLAPSTTSAAYSQTDLVVGTGAVAAAGNNVTVGYSGWLHNSARPDAKGTQFDSGTITFALGTGRVIRGWDMGVAGMRAGGQRRLIIPPELAYGNNSPDLSRIPQNATLVFDVTLNAVQ
jgi:FKBP-type peptidyl-prolyl cis-trans isomerase FkpA